MLVFAAALLSIVPGTVLVLPPDAPSGRPEAWVVEMVADQLPRSLAFLGVPAIERADRLQALAALEIPVVALTRATSIRMAEALVDVFIEMRWALIIAWLPRGPWTRWSWTRFSLNC